MKIQKVKNYHEMSVAGAVIIHEAVMAKLSRGEQFNLGLATGNTMIELYEILAGMFNDEKADLSKLQTWNLDEYAADEHHAVGHDHPLSYWKAVTHQCTCIWLFPHFMQVPPIGAKAAQKRSEHLSKKIAKDIQAQKLSKKDPGAFFLNAAENKAWPTILKLKAKQFKVSEKCIGCGQCAKICPRENIEIKNGKAFIGRNCVGCLGCLQYCPTKAISLGKVTDRREHYTNPNVTVAELTSSQIHI